MNAISMNNLWSYLQGLSLTSNNRKWLADKLISVNETKQKSSSIKKIHIGNVTLPTDKFIGMYNFSEEDEERMKEQYLKDKYNLD